MYEIERFGSNSEGGCLAYRVVRRHGRCKPEIAGTFSCELHGTMVARESAKTLALMLNAIEVGYDKALSAMEASNDD
jgi:hypothetical protein